MPRKPANHICILCRNTFIGTGSLCPACKPADPRQGSSNRGYDREWRRVRVRVLESCNIPRDQWRLYAVDHNPPYNKAVESDHTKYVLIPRLISDHNHKTATEDMVRDYKGQFKGKKR